MTIQADAEVLKDIREGYTEDPWCGKLTETKEKTLGIEKRDGLLYIGERLVIPRHKGIRAEQALVVGYVGRFVAIKDLPTLVHAFARVAAQRPDAVLLLVGDGEGRAEIDTLAAALMLQKQVHLAGWVDDLARLYATIDICALSSLNEGTPVAVIEAMAAAKAVVATRVGGVADVVEHERTGLLVPPQNPEALADAIVRLASAPGERSRMGAAARQAVVARFSSERLVEDIDTLYTAALAQKRSARAVRV